MAEPTTSSSPSSRRVEITFTAERDPAMPAGPMAYRGTMKVRFMHAKFGTQMSRSFSVAGPSEDAALRSGLRSQSVHDALSSALKSAVVESESATPAQVAPIPEETAPKKTRKPRKPKAEPQVAPPTAP